MKELPLDGVELREIKTAPMTNGEVEAMQAFAGSYEALFSKRAQKYKSMGLKEKNLSEEDMKALIVDEYTFLKRPVLLMEDQVVVGNSKASVEAMKEVLS